MKKLILATLVGLTLAPQMQSQPMSNVRWAKEFALGFKDYLYGMLWLTRGNNSQRNFVKGFEDTQWWKKNIEQKRAAIRRAENMKFIEFLNLNCIQ